MAFDRQRGGSEKLPHPLPIPGTVLSREQLRQQFSENNLSSGTIPRVVNKSVSTETYAEPRKVRFKETQPPVQGKEDTSSADDEEKATPLPNRATNQHGASSFKTQATPSRQPANHNSGASVLPPRVTTPLHRSSNQDEGPAVESSPVRRRETMGRDGREGRREEEETLEALVSLYEEEKGKVQGVLELSTLRQRRVPRVKVRVICLIDVSGSMLHKQGDPHHHRGSGGGPGGRRSKISVLKTMAVDVIDALEDQEDFFGVLTFGEETRMLCPLTRVTSSSRPAVKSTLSQLDKGGGFSSLTDLSSALQDAVQILSAEQQQDESLLYRNCIIIFSDGEVNAGETDPYNLVHLTREKIRQCRLPHDILADLWVNISCVTTGTNFSQALYTLSKMCGSDAYFYVDGSKNFPETDMLIPLMLRKTACAQMVSVTVRACNGAVLETRKCSQEHSVRRRKGDAVKRDTLAYFLHDLSSGIMKTFQISLDLENFVPSHEDEKDILVVDVQYVDALGVLHNIRETTLRHNVVTMGTNHQQVAEIKAKTVKTRMRSVLQNTCREVATVLETSRNDPGGAEPTHSAVKDAVEAGKKETEKLSTDILHQLKDGSSRSEMEKFSQAVQANLSKIQSAANAEQQNRGKGWQYTKAISSSVVRELPTVSDVVVLSSVLCPLPKQRVCESKRTQALSIYVMGEEREEEEENEEERKAGGGGRLHAAAKDLARSLADVLKSVESASKVSVD